MDNPNYDPGPENPNYDPRSDTVRSVAELIQQDKGTSEKYEVTEVTEVDGYESINNNKAQDMQDIEERISLGSILSVKTKPPWKERIMNEYKIKIFLTVLFVIIVAGVSVIFHFYNKEQYLVEMGRRIYFHEDTRQLDVLNIDKDVVLHGELGQHVTPGLFPFDCTTPGKEGVELCLEWRREANLTIKYHQEGTSNCYNIMWTGLREGAEPQDCYQLEGAHWYGGGLYNRQLWPLEFENLNKTAYVTGTVHGTNTFGPVVEKYWLSSRGIAIIVKGQSPLHVSINATTANGNTDGLLCFVSDYDDIADANPDNRPPRMNYSICVDKSIKDVHHLLLDNDVATPPETPPSEKMFRYPMWSTRAKFNSKQITQSDVLEYASNIANNEFESSLLMISRWQKAEGDFEFDETRFPNVTLMINELHGYGFDVGLSLRPISCTNSDTFQELINQKYFVRDRLSGSPGLVNIYSGQRVGSGFDCVAGVVDLSGNSKTWLHQKLASLKSRYNIESFQFDGGETDVLPVLPEFNSGASYVNSHTKAYGELAADYGLSSIVSSAYRNQDKSQFIRTYDRESHWNRTLGLQSIIPSVLSLSIVGYPYIIPDSIGGANYGVTSPPPRGLYIRWMQLTTFLPVMHFSYPPSDYDSQVVDIAKSLLETRSTVVTPIILKLAEEATELLYPIIRPLWWVDPTDKTSFLISDQFMVGDSLLVAPVVTRDTYQRDVYFPEGDWLYSFSANSETTTGPQWVRLDVPIDQVLYFTKS